MLSPKEYDPAYHLGFKEVQVDSRSAPTFLQVQIKASMTEPFRQGVTVYVGCTDNGLCLVTAVLSYLMARGSDPGPPFKWEDERFLTREAFLAAVRKALVETSGLAAKDYAGHSFRIGAATSSAGYAGLSDKDS